VRKEYGQDHIRFLHCRECKKEFSERRGTPLFNTKISEAKAVSVVEHLAEGCGIRPTGRLMKVSKETVARLVKPQDATPSNSMTSGSRVLLPKLWSSMNSGHS
jgi:transposase-like protein